MCNVPRWAELERVIAKHEVCVLVFVAWGFFIMNICAISLRLDGMNNAGVGNLQFPVVTTNNRMVKLSK